MTQTRSFRFVWIAAMLVSVFGRDGYLRLFRNHLLTIGFTKCYICIGDLNRKGFADKLNFLSFGGFVMEIENSFLRQAIADIGVNVIYVKGQIVPVQKCWHFSTDGNGIDVIFYDERDFIDAMNRIFVVLKKFKIIILAFCLMDNHVHFVLYGDFDECNHFVHEYVRRTSIYLAHYHGDRHKFNKVGISHQAVTDMDYLKTVICYVHKNPYYAGLSYLPEDYPWSSGMLLFRNLSSWSVLDFDSFEFTEIDSMTERNRRRNMKTHCTGLGTARMVGNMVYPGEYVSVQLTEAIFKTHKSYFYCLSRTRQDEVDSRGGCYIKIDSP